MKNDPNILKEQANKIPSCLIERKKTGTQINIMHRDRPDISTDVLGVVQHGREDKGKLKERSLTLSDSSKCLAIFHRRRKSSSTNEGLCLTSSKSARSLREVYKKKEDSKRGKMVI